MNLIEFFKTIIPPAVTVLSIIITAYISTRQIKTSIHEREADQRRELYTECFALVDRVINDNMLIFDKNYFVSLEEIKPKIKLIASVSVLKEFENYYNFVACCYFHLSQFCKNNDPTIDPAYDEYVEDEEGEEEVITHISEADLELFDIKVQTYQREHCPEQTKIKERVYALLNKMRMDLGYDQYDGNVNFDLRI